MEQPSRASSIYQRLPVPLPSDRVPALRELATPRTGSATKTKQSPKTRTSYTASPAHVKPQRQKNILWGIRKKKKSIVFPCNRCVARNERQEETPARNKVQSTILTLAVTVFYRLFGTIPLTTSGQLVTLTHSPRHSFVPPFLNTFFTPFLYLTFFSPSLSHSANPTPTPSHLQLHMAR